MADWKKRATVISEDVVFFEYVSSKDAKNCDVVYIWDIDKTYLETQFETLRGLWKTAVEKAFQKKNVPGTGSLVRALTSSSEEIDGGGVFPIYFVSASPPQMERKIKMKLEIDGIEPFGIFFKDNLRNLKPKLLKRLTQQVGFKLHALMELRLRLKENVKLVLWGDDSETDAICYSLYSDICARRIGRSEIQHILSTLNVQIEQAHMILELQERAPNQDPVEKIYINLANDTDPEYYAKFGRRTLATFNTFQAALDLYQDHRLTDEQLVRVAQDMRVNYGFTKDELGESFEDLIARRILTPETCEKVLALLKSHSLVPEHYVPNARTRRFTRTPETIEETWVPEIIDYLKDFR